MVNFVQFWKVRTYDPLAYLIELWLMHMVGHLSNLGLFTFNSDKI